MIKAKIEKTPKQCNAKHLKKESTSQSRSIPRIDADIQQGMQMVWPSGRENFREIENRTAEVGIISSDMASDPQAMKKTSRTYNQQKQSERRSARRTRRVGVLVFSHSNGSESRVVVRREARHTYKSRRVQSR